MIVVWLSIIVLIEMNTGQILRQQKPCALLRVAGLPACAAHEKPRRFGRGSMLKDYLENLISNHACPTAQIANWAKCFGFDMEDYA